MPNQEFTIRIGSRIFVNFSMSLNVRYVGTRAIKEEEASRCILKKRNTNGVCVSWESQAQTVLKKSLRLMKQRNYGGG